jgi:hypothetical protein
LNAFGNKRFAQHEAAAVDVQKKSKPLIDQDLLLRREGRRSRLLTDDTADRECDHNGNSQQ